MLCNTQNKINKFQFKVPEDLLQQFDLVVWIFFGILLL